MGHLRRRRHSKRPFLLLTRSCAILDLTAVWLDGTILYCPVNHSPPIRAAPTSQSARLRGRRNVCSFARGTRKDSRCLDTAA